MVCQYHKLTTQTKTGLLSSQEVSSRTLGYWFAQDFKDTAVCPHKTDYCGECFEYKTSMKALQQKINLFKVILTH